MEIKSFSMTEATFLILLFVEDSRNSKWSKQLKILGRWLDGVERTREKLAAVILRPHLKVSLKEEFKL